MRGKALESGLICRFRYQHDLSDVPRLSHEAERRGGGPQRKGAQRQRGETPGRELRDHFLEQGRRASRLLQPKRVQIDREIAALGADLAELL